MQARSGENSTAHYSLWDLVASDYPQFGTADADCFRATDAKQNPNFIVNATVYSDADDAQFVPELARTINGIGLLILAEEAKKLGADLG